MLEAAAGSCAVRLDHSACQSRRDAGVGPVATLGVSRRERASHARRPSGIRSGGDDAHAIVSGDHGLWRKCTLIGGAAQNVEACKKWNLGQSSERRTGRPTIPK